MSRRALGLIGLCFLGLMWAASPAVAATGYLGAGFDIFTDNSLRVREVLAGSPAETAGMKPGDIVLSIDGQAPGTGEQIAAVMKAAQPGQTMSFRLRRGGQVVTASARLIDHSKPAAAPAASSKGPASAPPADTKAYCKKLYGKAYMLCGMSDHDCKFLAADKWEQCQKTGRWP
jgi:predicted metalloprotease with PDZ domain